MPNRERRVSDRAAQIMERKGGLGMPNMVLRDGDSGETLYDNRDATAMAKFFIAKGGHAANNRTPTETEKFVAWFTEKYLMEVWKCSHCNSNTSYHLWTIYVGSSHPMDQTNTPRIVCWNCWKDSPPLQYKDETHKTACELTYPLTDRICDLHFYNSSGKYDLIKEFIEKNNINLEQE